MLNTSVPLHSQKVGSPQDTEFEYTRYGVAPSLGSFDHKKYEWTMDDCSSTVLEARKRSTPTCAGTVDDAPIRKNYHALMHTALHDHRGAHYRVSNHPAYSDLSSSLPIDLPSPYTTGDLLGYLQGDENVPTFDGLLFAHHTSTTPAVDLVSRHPFQGHDSIKFDDRSEDYDRTNWGDRSSEQAIGLEVSWPALSSPVVPALRGLDLSDYSAGENIRTSTDLAIFCTFCVETTVDATAAHIFHNSAVGMNPGCIDDSGRVDPGPDPSTGLNLPSSLLSDTATPSHMPHTFECFPYSGEKDTAILPQQLVVDRLHEDAVAHRNRTITCGWIKPNGEPCNEKIDYHCEGHFATAHGIRNMSSDVKVECRWCPPGTQKQVKRKGFIRHLREVHMKYKRPQRKKKKIAHLVEEANTNLPR